MECTVAGHQIQTGSFVFTEGSEQAVTKATYSATQKQKTAQKKLVAHILGLEIRHFSLKCRWALLLLSSNSFPPLSSSSFPQKPLGNREYLWKKSFAMTLTPAHLRNGCLHQCCTHCKSLQTSGSANCQKCILNGSVQRSSHQPC